MNWNILVIRSLVFSIIVDYIFIIFLFDNNFKDSFICELICYGKFFIKLVIILI